MKPNIALSHPAWSVAIVSLACFISVLPNGFCDDGLVIVARNEKILAAGGWRTIWTTDYWSEMSASTPNRDLLYRPVALSSYRLVHGLAGNRAWVHHLINMALHALVAVLLVRLCACIGVAPRATLIAGLFFAVMPIHTEVLNNVVGRADLLAAAGVFGAMLLHHRARSGDPKGRRWGIAAASLCAFLAMGAKESGVSVVALIVLLDVVQRRSNNEPTLLSKAIHSIRRTGYLLLPTAGYLTLRFFALDGKLHQTPALTKTVNVLVDAPSWQHALGVVQLWGMYWGKMLWPDILSVSYSINAIRLATSVLDIHVCLGAAVLISMGAFSVYAWRRGRPSVAFASVATVIAYALTSNSWVLIQVFFAERIWYLPSAFACVVIASAVEPLLRRRVVAVVGIVLMVAMMSRCWIRSLEWRDNGTLYAASYRDLPNAVVSRYAFGHWLLAADDPEQIAQGVALLAGSLEIDPGFTDAQRAIGQGYYRMGDYAQAVEHLQIAEMQAPGHAPTRALLHHASRALMQNHNAALAAANAAARAAPDNLERELALVRVLRDLGQLDEAIDRFTQAGRRFATRGAWHHEYAVTLVLENRRDEAIARYQACLKWEDHDPKVFLELAMLLLERRDGDDLDQAWSMSERAAALAPGASAVLHCQAELRALSGDLAGARRLLRQAIDALPNASGQRIMLRNRLTALGG